MKTKNIIFLFAALLMLSACGDPVIDVVEQQDFVPKIVMEVYLYPGEEMKDLRLMRNFPLNTQPTRDEMILRPDVHNVNAAINGKQLAYDTAAKSWYVPGGVTEFNTTYNIEVTATIDGNTLTASSTTTTPGPGFQVIEDELGTFQYGGNDVYMHFTPSQNAGFYVFSVIPDTASPENYIYDNVHFPDAEPKDIEEGLSTWIFQAQGLTNMNLPLGVPFEYHIWDLDYWFYSSYTVTAYAGDKNFQDFFLTVQFVQEFDGNFHEPKTNIIGDGIGVFASAVRDEVTFTIVPNE